MNDTRIRSAIDSYVAAWNEHDAEARKRLIAEACAEDVRILAPGGQRVHGRADLDALIVDFHRRRPGDRGRLSSAVEIHEQIFRFAAVIEGSAVAAPVEMLDAGECDEDGRIRLIFFVRRRGATADLTVR